MESVKFSCRCANASSRWSEMPAEERHRYRVECDSCGKFIKWGAVSELHYRVKTHHKITVVPYDPDNHRPSRAIDDFLA